MPLPSIGELLDRSWERYRGSFPAFMAVSGWLLAPALLSVVALALYPSATKIANDVALTGAETAGVALFALANWIVGPVVGLWVFIALVRLARPLAYGGRADVREAMRDGFRLFWPALYVSALVFLVLVGAGVASLGIPAILAFAAATTDNGALVILSSVAMIAGFVALLVLGISWSVRYYLSPFALLVDGTRGRASLSASRALVKGRFGATFLRLAAPKVVFLMFGLLAMVVGSFVFALAASLATASSLDAELRLSTIFGSLLSTVIAILLNPLIVLADVHLYRSLSEK